MNCWIAVLLNFFLNIYCVYLIFILKLLILHPGVIHIVEAWEPYFRISIPFHTKTPAYVPVVYSLLLPESIFQFKISSRCVESRCHRNHPKLCVWKLFDVEIIFEKNYLKKFEWNIKYFTLLLSSLLLSTLLWVDKFSTWLLCSDDIHPQWRWCSESSEIVIIRKLKKQSCPPILYYPLLPYNILYCIIKRKRIMRYYVIIIYHYVYLSFITHIIIVLSYTVSDCTNFSIYNMIYHIMVNVIHRIFLYGFIRLVQSNFKTLLVLDGVMG